MSGYWDLAVTVIVGIVALVWVLWQRRHPRIRAVDLSDAEQLTEQEIRDQMQAEGWEPVHAQTFEEHTAQAMDLIYDAVFTEEDEPVADVVAAFERGEKGVTKRPDSFQLPHRTYRCPHAIVSGPLAGTPAFPCGCDMEEDK